MTSIRIFICLLLLLARGAWAESVPAKTQTAVADVAATTLVPIDKGQHIFAAHHSYFLKIPPILDSIAALAGIQGEEFVGTRYIGGSKSIQHWDLPDKDNQAKQALKAGTVDVLILTPVYLPDEGIEKFAQLGFEHNPNIRVAMQESWLPFEVYDPRLFELPRIPRPTNVDHNAQTGEGLRKMHEPYFREWDGLVRSINQKLGKQVVFVVPAGQAVIALREKVIAGQAPGIKAQVDLFADALGHPKPPLQTLIAYVYYAVIYRKNPVGLPVPPVLKQAGLTAEDAEGLNRLLQELAWDAAIHHPLSGVKAP